MSHPRALHKAIMVNHKMVIHNLEMINPVTHYD